MKKLLKFIRNLLETGSLDGMTPAERYLSQSTDFADLERRQRELTRPKTNLNSKGWV